MFMIIYFKGATTRRLCATLNQPEAPAAAAEDVQVEAEAWGTHGTTDTCRTHMTAAAKPRIATKYYIIVDHHDDERGDESCSSSRRRGEERKKEKEGKEEGRPEVKERGKRASPPTGPYSYWSPIC